MEKYRPSVLIVTDGRTDKIVRTVFNLKHTLLRVPYI